MEIEGKGGWIIEGGGGAEGTLAPPPKLLRGPGPPCPPPLFLRLWSGMEFIKFEITT